MLAKCEGLPGAAAPDVRIADIAAPDAAQQLQEAFSGCEALIVCTSAVPEPIPGEVAPNGWPKYRWKGGQTPGKADNLTICFCIVSNVSVVLHAKSQGWQHISSWISLWLQQQSRMLFSRLKRM